MRLGLGLGSRPPLEKPYTYGVQNAETTTLLARFVGSYSEHRKAAIDRLLGELVAGGIWANIDVLYIFAAPHQTDANLNWKSASFTVTDPGTTAPAWVADRGYTGDGTTDYLSTNWNPSTAGGNLLRDDAAIGAWINTNVASVSQFDCGSINLRISGRGGAGSTIRINSTTGVAAVLAPASNSIGFHCGRRNNSANCQAIHNTGALATAVAASAALSNLPFFILAQCNSGTTPLNFSTRQVAMVFGGGALTDGEIAAAEVAFRRYMLAIGNV